MLSDLALFSEYGDSRRKSTTKYTGRNWLDTTDPRFSREALPASGKRSFLLSKLGCVHSPWVERLLADLLVFGMLFDVNVVSLLKDGHD